MAAHTGEVRRSGRVVKLPSHLKDFIVKEFKTPTQSVASTANSRIERLHMEREFIRDDVEEYCRQADLAISQRASRSELDRIDGRLGKSLAEMKSITNKLLDIAEEHSPGEVQDAAHVMSITKRQVEKYQDKIANNIESKESPVTYVELSKYPPDEDTMSNSGSVSGASVKSSKSMEAKIKYEVATMQAQQEKRQLEEERRLKEAEQRLQLRKREDEAARAKLEAELWSREEDCSRTPQPRSRREEPQSHDRGVNRTPFVGDQTFRSRGIPATDYRQDADLRDSRRSAYPSELDNSMYQPNLTGFTPAQDHQSEQQELRKFFQGMAKPSLPKFKGDKDQFCDWWEQYHVFVHTANVPTRYKMIMLKNSLLDKPADLVKRLGHSEVQYDLAIRKLHARYGGEKRLLQQHMDAIAAFQPIKEDDLHGLESFSNRLHDVVAKLIDAGRSAEVYGPSSLYTSVLQKIPDKLLIDFQNKQSTPGQDSLFYLTEWLERQVIIRLETAELKEGLKKKSKKEADVKKQKPQKSGAHVGNSGNKGKSAGQPGKPESTQKKGPEATPPESSAGSKPSCILCGEAHAVRSCKQWLAAEVQDRWTMAKEHKLCYRCLKPGHQGRDCFSTKKCGKDGCEKTHNRSLHPVEDQAKANATRSAFGVDGDGKVITTKVGLRLLPVCLIGEDGKRRKVTAFLDDGSDSSYIRTEVAKSLGLHIEDNELTLSTLIKRGTKVPSGLVKFTLESLDGQTRCDIGARTLDSLCEGLGAPNWTKLQRHWTHLAGINFPKVAGQSRVDVLIGSDHPELAVSLEERRGKQGEPVARLTPLGWTCVGTLHPVEMTAGSHFTLTYNTCSEEVALDEQMKVLWNMDVLHSETAPEFTPEEKTALEKVNQSIRYQEESNRYQVGIPWKSDHPNLPDNKPAAVKRLRNLETSLKRKPHVAERYKEVMEDNIRKGYIQEISEDESKKPGWYLPHFAVVRDDRATTKVRVVYDGAARYEGKSLNDEMLAGPKLQNDLLDILIMFRQGSVALVGDVREMFSQIELSPEDRRYHRLLWRGLEEDSPIRTYEAVRLPFGDRASPFIAQFVVRTHAEKNMTEYPLAADACLTKTYMDDVLKSVDEISEAKQLLHQLKKLLSGAGFDIRKWCCNTLEVLEEVPEEERATGIVNLEDNELPCIKTLGIRWDAQSDTLGYSHTALEVEVVTKRTVLSHVARLFDPLQLLAPFVIRAKMILQQAWMEGLSWDEPLPDFLEKLFTDWVKELPTVTQFEVPRCYHDTGKPGETAIHVFTDASSLAYGVVVYIRNVYSDGSVTVRIVVAKTRVTPLKAISIPRLELMAAVLGLRLGIRVKNLLGCEELYFWTDSMDVIHWVHGQSRKYKPFVSHRIGEIHEYSSPAQWRHVPGLLNPADLLTRGEKVENLTPERIWVRGPTFLYQDEEDWPKSQVQTDQGLSELAQEEVKKNPVETTTNATGQTGTIDQSEFPVDYTRYTRWVRLVRVTALVLRFIKLIKSRGKLALGSILSVEELEVAEETVIRQIQFEHYKDTIMELRKGNQCPVKPLRPLMPFLDERGNLRVGGRLQNAALPYNAKHPYILPPCNHVTTLLIRKFHAEDSNHAKGVNAVLAETRQKFWIVNGREEVKRVDRECLQCIGRRKKLGGQVMAPLPECRITVPLRAFAQVGVDYAGPFLIKITRRCSAKRWICLFTCTTSRAVHLEVAYSLDTDGFLNAFSRMVARRGKPELVISDNGTNFVGAERELRELLENLDTDLIEEKTASKGIKWRFNPPWGSHHGGLFEALVKSAKKALRAILGEARLTEEEFHTALVEVEGILNSRPLTYCSSDPKDEPVLTPNHFLVGQAGGQLAPRVAEDIACSPKHRWLYTQQLISQVWKRWNKEFLGLLQTRGKWREEKEDMEVDDIVLVADPNNPRGRWPLGRVVETFPCKDGHVRSVRVLSSGKTFIRPISKLCPLNVRRAESEVVQRPTLIHGGEGVQTPPLSPSKDKG